MSAVLVNGSGSERLQVTRIKQYSKVSFDGLCDNIFLDMLNVDNLNTKWLKTEYWIDHDGLSIFPL